MESGKSEKDAFSLAAGNWTRYGGGASGSDAGRDDGQFNFPQGLAVSKAGMLYVADANNNRIEGGKIETATASPAAPGLLLLQ
ncbi:hypothetical protein [Desulfovibrio sp. TomC]|uniref:hypothetical protein n=1 Tax=Desulfovibrio sp. TomC TaxID=1562888 RepID=UPI0005740680|nr:hypothetical protein [Desulfovibrio sp. TomC]KHK03393.1 Serine/threonine protein kinase [Desulfovibrio sp. TomC]